MKNDKQTTLKLQCNFLYIRKPLFTYIIICMLLLAELSIQLKSDNF